LAIANNFARYRAVHPAIAIPLLGMLPLFLGALLADWAYLRSEQVQWINFAAWLNVGALVFAVAALLTTAFFCLFALKTWRTFRLSLALLGATVIVGLIAALAHARDAFATMPDALVLSAIALLLAIGAIWASLVGGRS